MSKPLAAEWDPIRPAPVEPAPDPPVELPEGRAAAVGTLFELHYVRLVALARRLLADPAAAEDVTMDAFVGLYRRWSNVRRPEDAFFYLRASVVNGSRTRLRRLNVSRSHLPSVVAPTAPAAEETALELADNRDLLTAIRSLSSRQRQVLVLRYFEGLSEAEIAATIGCSVGTVKTHAARGLRAVAVSMGKLR